MANVIHLLTQQVSIENLVRSWGYNITTSEKIPALIEFRVRKGIKKKNQTVSVQLHLRRAKYTNMMQCIFQGMCQFGNDI